MPEAIAAINDFVVKFANVNGSGSASANGMFAKSILRMGVPVAARNIFPSNIQGLPTWFEVRVTEAAHLGRRGGVDDVHHLAFVNGTEFFYSAPELVLDVGVKGMVNVIDACHASDVRRLVLASSSEVYQTPPEVAKKAAELLNAK